MDSIYITIGGEAGDGVLSAGEILCKIFFHSAAGLATYKNFPSRIRGGHTSYSIRVADAVCQCRVPETDILVAFDAESFSAPDIKVKKGGIVIYDPAKIKAAPDLSGLDAACYEVPLAEMATKNFGKPLYKNAILIGMVAAALGVGAAVVEKGFAGAIKNKKGEDVLKINLDACRLGMEHYAAGLSGRKLPMPSATIDDAVMMSGNECATMGALAAGCRFAAAYPISPATEIFEAMCSLLPKHGGTALQCEDEIAALCSAIGAGFAGARSMTSTSGPGIALMAEAIGLAGCAEVPVVIINAQRPGPSTGLPTKTEQGDLYHSIFCTHGDIPRVVLMAGNAAQCFDFTARAFNLAETLQCPVIMMTEQSVAQNKFIFKRPDISSVTVDRGKLLSADRAKAEGPGFFRYKFTEDGISPRAIPSQPGVVHIASGNEHDQSGRISEDPANRTGMMDKRQKKMDIASASPHLPRPEYFGDGSSSFGAIVIGQNAAAAAEALDILKKKTGKGLAIMQLTALMPFPAADVAKFAEKRERIFVIENNKAAQLRHIIQMHVPIHSKLASILKYDGLAFTAEEIAEKLGEAM